MYQYRIVVDTGVENDMYQDDESAIAYAKQRKAQKVVRVDGGVQTVIFPDSTPQATCLTCQHSPHLHEKCSVCECVVL